MWTAVTWRVQHIGPWVLVALALLAVLAAGMAAGAPAPLALPALPALPLPLRALPPTLPSPAPPAALVATPLFLQFGLTVAAGVLARKALGAVPARAAFTERARRTINRLVLWVTLPALVFDTVHGTGLGPDLLQGPAVAIAGMAGTAVIAWLLLVRLHGRTATTGGLVLAASAGSVSFLGVPVVRSLFAASDARVGVYFAVLNVPLALLSAAVLSRAINGRGEGARPGSTAVAGCAVEAARQFFSLPATWALAVGVALHDAALPAGVQHAVHALAASVAPTVMFALGLGLRFERSLAPYRTVLPAVVLKLAISPLVMLACAKAVGLSGPQLAVVVLQGAMPTQVLSVAIAERYRLDSRVVGLALAVDTALAFVLLPVLAGAMQALGTR